MMRPSRTTQPHSSRDRTVEEATHRGGGQSAAPSSFVCPVSATRDGQRYGILARYMEFSAENSLILVGLLAGAAALLATAELVRIPYPILLVVGGLVLLS